MKSNPIFVAAAGFAMVGACSVTTADNAAENTNGNSGESAASADQGNALPATDENAQADTLGNQLNQLNADAQNSSAADTNSASTNSQ